MALAGGGALLWWTGSAPAVHWKLPAFRLVAQDGSSFGGESLAGHPWVAGFIFTRCHGICPAMTAEMARLRPALPAGARLVSFTVDPAHDTPEVLAAYGRAAGAGPEWVFLTGARDDLYRLAIDGFRLQAMEVPEGERLAGGDGPFLHSGKLVLVDGEGRVRGYYASEDPSAMRRLGQDARRLSGFGVRDLPTVNAALNATSALLMLLGWLFIRAGRREAHKKAMLAAVTCSAAFLACYVAYHVEVGSVRFGGSGLLRAVYLLILVTHIILAATVVPLVLVSVRRGLSERYDAHRRIARVTLPVWAYVSVTGVVVYWMLYHL